MTERHSALSGEVEQLRPPVSLLQLLQPVGTLLARIYTLKYKVSMFAFLHLYLE